MSSTLFDYEWQFLLQMVTRVNYSNTYAEACDIILQQIKTLIPFQRGIIFQAARDNGQAVLTNPVSNEAVDDSSDHAFFIEGQYPHWNEFIMSPYSIVSRQSDIITPSKWEKTRVYREVWLPKNIFWGLFISLVHKDCPLAVLGVFRERNADDFSARDIYIMNTLKDPLERKFYSILNGAHTTSGDTYPDRIIKRAANYGFTKRETEIISLVCSGKGSDEMCRILYITHATLSKHLSNIYAKTHVKNRTQLFALFSDN